MSFAAVTSKELWEALEDAGKSKPKAIPAGKRCRKTQPATHEPPESCSVPVPVQTTPSKRGRKKRRCTPEKGQGKKQEAQQDREKDQRMQDRNQEVQDTEKDQHMADRNQEAQDTEKDQRTQDRNQKAEDTEKDQRTQDRNQKAQVTEREEQQKQQPAEVTESECEEDVA